MCMVRAPISWLRLQFRSCCTRSCTQTSTVLECCRIVRFSQYLPKQHDSHRSRTPQSDWLVQDAAGSAVGRMVRL